MNSSEGISREYVENSSWENETCAFGRNDLKFAAMATKHLIGRALWRREEMMYLAQEAQMMNLFEAEGSKG